MPKTPKDDEFKAIKFTVNLQQRQIDLLETFISQLNENDKKSVEKYKSTKYKFMISDKEKYDNFIKESRNMSWDAKQEGGYASFNDAQETIEEEIKQFHTQVHSNLNLFFGASWLISLVIALKIQSPCLETELGTLRYRLWLFIDCGSTLLLVFLLLLRIFILCVFREWSLRHVEKVELILFKVCPYGFFILKIGWIIVGMIIFMNIDFAKCDSNALQFSIAYFLGCVVMAMKLVILLIDICLAKEHKDIAVQLKQNQLERENKQKEKKKPQKANKTMEQSQLNQMNKLRQRSDLERSLLQTVQNSSGVKNNYQMQKK